MMNMANYWDAKREGRTEGRTEGRAEGMERGNATSLVNHVTKCMNKHDFSLEETLDMLGETMEDYLKAKSIVEQDEVMV